MRRHRIDGSFHSHGGSIENYKRRRALPAMPGFSDDLKFFEKILNVRKIQELVFITKTAAKNR
jgi:hypothetical protein